MAKCIEGRHSGLMSSVMTPKRKESDSGAHSWRSEWGISRGKMWERENQWWHELCIWEIYFQRVLIPWSKYKCKCTIKKIRSIFKIKTIGLETYINFLICSFFDSISPLSEGQGKQVYSSLPWSQFYRQQVVVVDQRELLWKELIKAELTVGLVVLFSEDAFWQLCQAESTHKVLRVKLVPHGTDAAASDGLPTAMAEGPLPVMVMEFTEWTAIQFKEGARRKAAEAVLWIEWMQTREMHVKG